MKELCVYNQKRVFLLGYKVFVKPENTNELLFVKSVDVFVVQVRLLTAATGIFCGGTRSRSSLSKYLLLYYDANLARSQFQTNH